MTDGLLRSWERHWKQPWKNVHSNHVLYPSVRKKDYTNYTLNFDVVGHFPTPNRNQSKLLVGVN